MEKWAETLPEVQFLCVCVESQGVAQMFDQMFNFEHAVNCYIPSMEYMPRGYGQLGCSGFVVSDGKGNFVSRKTKAYLQYGENAFREVEALLATLVVRDAATAERPADKRQRIEEAAGGSGGRKNEFDSSYTEQRKAPPLKYHLPPSVGIYSMDREHEGCAKALRTLSEEPTKISLLEVINELENHFAHEEELMLQHGFGGDVQSAFSAINSHITDHVRILDLARVELKRLEDENSLGCASSSSY